MPEVRVDEVQRFMEEALRAAGAPPSEAEAHAALLLHADTTGHFSHGLNRLVFYINDIKKGAVNANAKPTILKEAAATAWVDGGSGLGATVGNFCMDLAIKKARESGVGVVSAKGCTHFGMAGYWALKAERQGLIGLAFTNSSPVMVPTRAKDAAMGTNPIAFFAPAANGDSLGVDMASTAVALGKIEVQIHKGEPIPEGWAYGPDGKPTTDAQLAFDTYRLMPLGGMEATSGYKGYGLSAAIEVLCGGLSGANMSYQNGPWSIEGAASAPNLGQCFMAIDPGQFAPGFGERIAAGLQHWRSLEPMDPSLPVLAPGDKERANAEQTKKKGTISYARNMIDMYARVAQHLGVKPMEILE
ncbi:(2R)-3-sulfolactate dehydrogenase (NADP(+))-like [Ostrinia nubilalis]|uniref:(2R)-3-sulfolactate dehydrogenase (NADP(+))-like n=1 Tax=Ostrinia nubilalis TaxID=29057 RepID=UPI003082203F